MAHIRQSRPDSGLGFQFFFEVVPSLLEGLLVQVPKTLRPLDSP